MIEELNEEITGLRRRLEVSEQKREEMQDKIVSSTNIQQDVQFKMDKFKDMVVKENEDLRKALVLKDKE